MPGNYMSDEIILKVENLSKSFGQHQVIQNLSMVVHRGERIALFAPSGAGKTTLIRILAGLELPTSGNYLLREEEPVTIFQEPRLFPFLTVEENICLPFKARREVIDSNIRRRYREWLEVCELSSFRNYYPYQLSGGMKQKVSLIRGLLGNPHFVMMDEPFQSIGADSKQAIVSYLLQTNSAMTLLFITHICDEVSLIAHQVIYFQQPCLTEAIQMPAECFQQSVFYSRPSTNFTWQSRLSGKTVEFSAVKTPDCII
jgi:NitT/TauT family transport system ATP-binding protein